MRNSRLLYIVRHGETADNAARQLVGVSDAGLTPKGSAQMSAAASHLKHGGVARISSSAQPRALQSSEILASSLRVPVQQDTRLRERDFGPYEGLDRDKLVSIRTELGMANPEGSQDWEGIDTVESDAQILTRVEPLVASSEKAAGNDLWVTHAGVIHVLVCHLLRINRDGFDRFYFPNGSVTALQKRRGKWRLVELWAPRQGGDEDADRRLPP